MIQYPQKTVFSIFWFALLGAIAIVISTLYFDASWTVAPPASGVLKSVEYLGDRKFELESDAERLMRNESIEKPHQVLDMAEKDSISTFAQNLLDLAYGRRREPVRILHYGDSILTTDELSGRVRHILQKRFGDAGHGFVLLAKPWIWYRHLGVAQGARLDDWNIRPFTSAPMADGLYGLGGVAFIAKRGTKAQAWMGPVRESEGGFNVRWFDISYLKQPRGGCFDIYIDDQFRERVSTMSDKNELANHRIEVPMGRPRIKIESANNGHLRLFGVSMENGEPGVIYDSLAVNGARATALTRFDEEHFIQAISQKEPSLVILMMGANEGANSSLNLEQYKKDLLKVINKIKKAGEGASCLVVGPLDQAERCTDGKLVSKKMPALLNEVQKEVALNNNCAFFDTYEAMGGKGSMPRWCTSGLGGADLIHPTTLGAQKIGNWLAESLLYAYQQYSKNGDNNMEEVPE